MLHIRGVRAGAKSSVYGYGDINGEWSTRSMHADGRPRIDRRRSEDAPGRRGPQQSIETRGNGKGRPGASSHRAFTKRVGCFQMIDTTNTHTRGFPPQSCFSPRYTRLDSPMSFLSPSRLIHPPPCHCKDCFTLTQSYGRAAIDTYVGRSASHSRRQPPPHCYFAPHWNSSIH